MIARWIVVWGIIGWAMVVAIAVALAFLLAVGAGFGRTPTPLVKRFITVALAPGATLDKRKPLLLLPIAWAAWTAAGAMVILAVNAIR